MSEHGVSWGKIIAGAAIAAGAVAVFVVEPSWGAKILESTKEAATYVYDKLGDAAAWAWDKVVGAADPKLATEVSKQATVVANLEDATRAASELVSQTTGPAAESAAQAKGLLESTFEAAKKGLATSEAALEKSAKGLFGFAVQNKALAIGAGAIAGGLLATGTHSKAAKAHRQEMSERQESFALKEDMRRMQALMAARMMAQGYQPAMALAGQGRQA